MSEKTEKGNMYRLRPHAEIPAEMRIDMANSFCNQLLNLLETAEDMKRRGFNFDGLFGAVAELSTKYGDKAQVQIHLVISEHAMADDAHAIYAYNNMSKLSDAKEIHITEKM